MVASLDNGSFLVTWGDWGDPFNFMTDVVLLACRTASELRLFVGELLVWILYIQWFNLVMYTYDAILWQKLGHFDQIKIWPQELCLFG